jgi:glycosyltransferase involved in cell wall biosynthesis
MRILLVNDYATISGGSEVQTRALRDELRRRGHEVRVLASRALSSPGPIWADYTCYGTLSRARTLVSTLNPSAFWTLRQALREFKPDVVHVRVFLTQLSPLILPLLRGVPSLYSVALYKPLCPLGTKLMPDHTPCQVRAGVACYRGGCLPLHAWLPLMLQMFLWRKWRGAFTLIVTPSNVVRQRLMDEGIAPVQVVPNGQPIVPARPPLASPPVVAFAGRLVPIKGVDVLVRAFALVRAKIPTARLLIAGDGPERARLARLIQQLDLADGVSMTGNLSRSEMETLFAAAWVQAVPSLTEVFGNVAAEAMMRGTAVVASRVGGLSELVNDGETGLLVPPGDVTAHADALRRLLEDRDLAERFGSAGRERALACFAVNVCVDRFLSLYRTIASARASDSHR